MAKKFIPNGDSDFAEMANTFALGLASSPEKYGVSIEESATLTAAVERFRQALTDTRFGGRSAVATAKKEAARAEAEKIIRRIGHAIRTNPAIDAAALIGVGMRERSTATKVEGVPNEPPTLRFVRAIHEEGNAPIHELTFEAKDGKARPAGATRIELFVDLIPADAPVLTYYDKGGRSRPIYVRSYTKGPIRIVPPMAQTPMRVVYFARWADASGDVGPISKRGHRCDRSKARSTRRRDAHFSSGTDIPVCVGRYAERRFFSTALTLRRTQTGMSVPLVFEVHVGATRHFVASRLNGPAARLAACPCP